MNIRICKAVGFPAPEYAMLRSGYKEKALAYAKSDTTSLRQKISNIAYLLKVPEKTLWTENGIQKAKNDRRYKLEQYRSNTLEKKLKKTFKNTSSMKASARDYNRKKACKNYYVSANTRIKEYYKMIEIYNALLPDVIANETKVKKENAINVAKKKAQADAEKIRLAELKKEKELKQRAEKIKHAQIKEQKEVLSNYRIRLKTLQKEQDSMKPNKIYVNVIAKRNDNVIVGRYGSGKPVFFEDFTGTVTDSGAYYLELMQSPTKDTMTHKKENGFTETYNVMVVHTKGQQEYDEWLKSDKGQQLLTNIEGVESEIKAVERKISTLYKN